MTAELGKLTTEIIDIKQKGLSFYCVKKLKPSHDCRKKKLYVIMGNNTTDCKKDNEEVALIWDKEYNQIRTEKNKNELKVEKYAIIRLK